MRYRGSSWANISTNTISRESRVIVEGTLTFEVFFFYFRLRFDRSMEKNTRRDENFASSFRKSRRRSVTRRDECPVEREKLSPLNDRLIMALSTPNERYSIMCEEGARERVVMRLSRRGENLSHTSSHTGEAEARFRLLTRRFNRARR